MPKEEKEDTACSAKKAFILSCLQFMVRARSLIAGGGLAITRCEVVQTAVRM